MASWGWISHPIWWREIAELYAGTLDGATAAARIASNFGLFVDVYEAAAK
jgi:hypothetical protein